MGAMMRNDLLAELRRLNMQVDDQLRGLQEFCKEQDIPAHRLMHTDGTFAMTPLLLAKAHVLAAMTQLEVAPK